MFGYKFNDARKLILFHHSNGEWIYICMFLISQFRKQNGIFVCTGDRIKKSEMGGEYGTYWGEEKCVHVIGGET